MRKILSLLLLLFSWGMVFFILTVLTEFVLVPWDTALERPEIGTWQRTLNDFFEHFPGNFLIASLLVITSIALTWRRVRPLVVLALGNLIFAVLVFSLFTFAALVNNAVFPYPPVLYDPTYPGYHRSIIPGLTVALVCGVWLRWQAAGFRLKRAPRRSESL